MTARELYQEYVQGTAPKKLVVLASSLICKLENKFLVIIQQYNQSEGRNVFLGTIALKHIYDRHIYDKNAPHDFETILNNLAEILEDPDHIYRNIPGKRAHYAFVKKINDQLFLCGIDIIGEGGQGAEIVSAFATGENYLRKFTLLWSREDG